MGLFSRLFDSDKHDGGEPRVRVREDSSDRSKVTADRYTSTSNGHTHESYNLDKASGSYREYSGGDRSSDRSYNK